MSALAQRAKEVGEDSVAVIASRDAIHAAVELWCAQTEPPILLAGAYFTAEHFLSEHPSVTKPGIDVVIFDPAGESTGVDFVALDRILETGHRVIVYSHLETDEVILTCLELGAVTYLTQSERKHHLINAIRAASTPDPYVGPCMARAMLIDRSVGRPNLAPREREVLIAWCRTHSKEHVAAQLMIAPATVRSHLQRIRAKYAAVGRPAPTKSALVARALQDGIISVHEM
jgi:DNA-binding NarL/FixJ family response regulator